ncbi:MAG: inorganic pyrophosphatase [Sphingobacteriales bacterium]|jgi:inorganic pyrophosphatase|nr:inorganic pyrophosphatase [Sphingobacteriales bacterium]MBP9141117.1 inorganic pyrophosphatase [Chitinophagales bacterium]MDA0197721.1 inorganic pyrophosphatase [Bacteroidota bacterium]MBK6888819.1 inorganic pyrophosphatase [Sphingobacteriales bacterium]MBK7528674.1 inorganic pyrophosphatase [Sphingobacteriales bacterium]
MPQPLFKAHPWHGISIGANAPQVVTAFIEIVPTDTVKYEIDKTSGYLKIDRPQLFSNIVPALYGFLPQTYCGEQIAQFCRTQTGNNLVTKGDGDPLDICVLCEATIPHGDIIIQCIPIGGFRLIDKNEADDKIIAVLQNDPAFGHLTEISQVPPKLINRLIHYFLTYKTLPGNAPTVQLCGTYEAEIAHQVIKHSVFDYKNEIA